jgi:hypothetical protein
MTTAEKTISESRLLNLKLQEAVQAEVANARSDSMELWKLQTAAQLRQFLTRLADARANGARLIRAKRYQG